MNVDEIDLARRLAQKFGRALWEPGMRIGAPDPLGYERGMPEPWSWTRLGAHDERDGMEIERVGEAAAPDLLDPATAYLLFERAGAYRNLESFEGSVREATVHAASSEVVYWQGPLGVVAARILLDLPPTHG
jgi:hypothetical protein